MLFLFHNYVLDTDRRELRRDGQPVPAEPQVFDLLVHLIRNRDRVVSKDDLIASVWNGRIVSDSTLDSRINAVRKAIGDSGGQQEFVRTVPRKGVRFVGTVREGEKQTETAAYKQDVSFCRSQDGVNIAFASVGSGPLLIKTGNWLNHLEYDWDSPLWAPLLHRLAQKNRLVRYDTRGTGLSDRDVAGVSFDDFERDLEAVIDAVKPERFAMLGISQGAAIAIAYAVRHPQRVTKLVLHGGYPSAASNAARPTRSTRRACFCR